MKHQIIFTKSILITLLSISLYTSSMEERTFSGLVALDIPRTVGIENLQKHVVTRLDRAFKKSVFFEIETMPHLSLVFIRNLPYVQKSQVYKALEAARQEFIQSEQGIGNITITGELARLGQRAATKNKFLAIHISPYSDAYQKINRLRKLIIRNLSKSGIELRYYQDRYPWDGHISLGKAKYAIPSIPTSLEKIGLGGTPFGVCSFSLLAGGSHSKGYEVLQSYPLYRTNEKYEMLHEKEKSSVKRPVEQKEDLSKQEVAQLWQYVKEGYEEGTFKARNVEGFLVDRDLDFLLKLNDLLTTDRSPAAGIIRPSLEKKISALLMD